MTRKYQYLILVLSLTLATNSCSLIKSKLSVRDGYQDFSDDNKLDSIQREHKEFYLTYFNTIKTENIDEFISLSCDSIFCFWETGDSVFHSYNNKLISIEEFIKEYYPFVFHQHAIEYFTKSESILYLYWNYWANR